MHGLMNRAIQGFVQETYGPDAWARVRAEVGLGPEGFEALQHYDDTLTETVLNSAAHHLNRSRESVLEDVGTYLVSGTQNRALRRLLRFGGPSFAEFVHSLEELPGRARLALPDLDLPCLRLEEPQPDVYTLTIVGYPGIGMVFLGLLRAMADDYGALVLLDCQNDGENDLITISLLDMEHSSGTHFALAMGGQ